MTSPRPLNMCEFSSLRMLRKNGWSVVDSCNPEPGDWRTYSQKPGARVSPARTSGTSCSGAKTYILRNFRVNSPGFLEVFVTCVSFLHLECSERILGVYIVDSCNPEPGDWGTYSQKPGARVSPARTSGTSCSGAKEHIVNCKKLTKYLEKFLSLAVFNSLYTCVHKFAEAASGA